MRKIRLLVLKNHEFENRDLSWLITLVAFSHYQDSDGKKNIDDISLEQSFWNTRLSTETLMKEFNHVVLKKNEFQD